VESALALSSEFAKIIRQARKEAWRGKIFPLDQVQESCECRRLGGMNFKIDEISPANSLIS